MTLRTVAREIKDYPATACLSLAWVIVFAAMVATWLHTGATPSWQRFFVLGIGESHRFGDLTLRELFQGQIWRLVTCNFVHLSILHIVLNIVGFYILGTIIESWYGSPQFVFIYLVTGSIGNLISAPFRHVIGSSSNSQSAGGSVVIMGLVGLCAVVGWRSRTAQGNALRWQMMKAMGLMVLLAVALLPMSGYIRLDNWGHAGGAIVGAILGLFHHSFLQRYRKPAGWGLGVVSTLVILASGAAQVAADRREAPLRKELIDYVERLAYDDANRGLTIVSFLGERVVDPRVVISAFQASRNFELFARGRTSLPYRRAIEIAQTALVRKLTDLEQIEFDRCLGQLSSQILSAYSGLFRRQPAASGFDQLERRHSRPRPGCFRTPRKTSSRPGLRPSRQRSRKSWSSGSAPTGTSNETVFAPAPSDEIMP